MIVKQVVLQFFSHFCTWFVHDVPQKDLSSFSDPYGLNRSTLYLSQKSKVSILLLPGSLLWFPAKRNCCPVKGGGCYPPRLKRITPSKICRILHILWKPNSIIIIAFIIHSKYFTLLKGVLPFHSLFLCSPKIAQNFEWIITGVIRVSNSCTHQNSLL